MNTQRGNNFIRATLNKCRRMGSKVLQHSPSTSCCESCCLLQWLNQQPKHKTTSNNTRSSPSKNSLKVPKDVPKGHMAVYVGENGRRFVVKISLLKHPLFVALLDQARDEHGDSTTPLKLWIPCDEAMFLDVVRCASSPTERHGLRIGIFCV